MSNLYAINDQIDDLTERMIDPETGEIDESILESLDQLKMEREAKIEYLALKVKNLRNDVEGYKAEKANFEERIKTSTNKADNIERYIDNILRGDPFSTSKVEIKWRKSDRVEIINAEEIPEKFMLCRTEMRPQKSLIKQAIKDGEEVPGAMLTLANNMQIK